MTAATAHIQNVPVPQPDTARQHTILCGSQNHHSTFCLCKSYWFGTLSEYHCSICSSEPGLSQYIFLRIYLTIGQSTVFSLCKSDEYRDDGDKMMVAVRSNRNSNSPNSKSPSRCTGMSSTWTIGGFPVRRIKSSIPQELWSQVPSFQRKWVTSLTSDRRDMATCDSRLPQYHTCLLYISKLMLALPFSLPPPDLIFLPPSFSFS